VIDADAAGPESLTGSEGIPLGSAEAFSRCPDFLVDCADGADVFAFDDFVDALADSADCSTGWRAFRPTASELS